MTTVDKRKALEVLPPNYESRLFFAARNLAIEAMLLRLENAFLRKGFDCSAEWRESSFGGPVISLKLKNPKPKESAWEFATASIYVDRDTITAPQDKASQCFYRLKDVQAFEYGGRESKYVLGFRTMAQEMGDTGHFAAEIDKVNFPFEYGFHSNY